MTASESPRSAKFALISSSRARLSSFGSVASNRSASFKSLCNAPARRCKAKLCLNTRSASEAAAWARTPPNWASLRQGQNAFAILAALRAVQPFGERRGRDQRVRRGGEQRVPQCIHASADEFGRRQFLEMALDQRRVVQRNRENHGLARRQPSTAAELASRRQGRFGDAHARPAREERPAPLWDEGLFRV